MSKGWDTVSSFQSSDVIKYDNDGSWSEYHGTSSHVYSHSARPDSKSGGIPGKTWLKPTPWTRKEYRSQTLTVALKFFENPSYPRYMYGTTVCALPVDFLPVDTISDLAVDRALMKLGGPAAGWGENIAQRQQAIDMVSGGFDKIRSGLRQFQRKHRKSWQQVKRLGVNNLLHVDSGYLELIYGWVPTLSDIYATYKYFADWDRNGLKPVVTVKAGAGIDDHQIISCGLGNPGPPLPPYPSVDGLQDRKSLAFVRLDYEMVNPALHALQEMGVLNPVALAWNLLPYSFVVDWALPIGSYLSSWTADLGFAFKSGSISVLEIQKFLPTSYKLAGNTVVGVPIGGEVKNVYFYRNVFDSSPSPRLPHFKNPLSGSHIGQSMALLAQQFGR